MVAPRYPAPAPGLGLLRPVGSAGVRRVRPVRRAPSTRNWARRLPAPWTHPGPWVDLLVTDAHAPIIGVLEPQTGGDLPGTDPIPRAGRRPARAGPDWRPACGSWGGPRAPGPRPAPPRDGRPRPTPAPRRISPDTVCRHRPIRRAMRAAQVPLRQARGDHGPLTGPQAQAPTGAPRHPRVGSPVIRWPQGAPAPPSAQDLTAMRGLDGGNGAGGGAHTRIVQPPARGRDRHAPGPGGPGPPGPGGPGLEHRPPAPGGRQGASTHGPHRQSHARPPSPPLHRRVRHAQLPSRRPRRPAIRNQLHRPQAHLTRRPSPHEAHRSLLRTRNGATTP